MNGAVHVRPAVASDARELHRLAAETFPLACPPHTTAESIRQFIETNLSEERMSAYLADPDRDTFLALNGDQGVGWAMLVRTPSDDADVLAALSDVRAVELSKCYVSASFHGGGVASALVAAALESARAHGCSSVWLGVNQENGRANAFYEKMGFRRVGTKRFLVGDRFEDDFVREITLQAG